MQNIDQNKPLLNKPVLAVFIIAFTLTASQLQAGEPTEQVRTTTNKVLEVLTKPELQGKKKQDARHSKVREVVDQRFDWTAMCRRALGRHWRGKTEKQRREFVELFGILLERRYMDKIDNYSGQKVVYQDEKIDDGYAQVDVAIITEDNKEINVQYRLQEKGKAWLVYDIVVEGVSMVNNYRAQFNSLLGRSSFAELLERLRKKNKSYSKQED
ncbi:MAG: ABC transporter substrate-binding protein [Lentisphaeria bacterium]